MRIAVTSSDGKFIDIHFGKCRAFRIFELNKKTKEFKEIEIRETERLCREGGHTEETLKKHCILLKDCKYVLTARIGVWIKRELIENGIVPIEFLGEIKEAVNEIT
jgi:predicted Fe-Mo cluster-binding NifX family protein